MIDHLIQHIITLLRQGFDGVIPSPESHIVTGALAGEIDELPAIAIYPSKLTWSQGLVESNSSGPRPQEFRQEIPVEAGSPQGPYPLAKTPLPGSAQGQLIFDPGEVTERRVTVLENKAFTIDYQTPAVSFSADLSEASLIRLTYSFVGVFTVKEFQQQFLVDVYDTGMAAVEKWASLANGMILTSHDELIEQYNVTAKTEYIANQFITRHTLGRLQSLEGSPGRQESALKMQLTYSATGYITLIKEIVDGFGLIQKIHSPGQISDHPVDIEIGLE